MAHWRRLLQRRLDHASLDNLLAPAHNRCVSVSYSLLVTNRDSEVPWDLYRSSRPKRPHEAVLPVSTDVEVMRLRDLASSELRRYEFAYLILSTIVPFLGASLFHLVLDSIDSSHGLSWFSTTLFVLATGIRPWSHIITRLRDRTASLHDVVHYPSSEHPQAELAMKLQRLSDRTERLEKELKSLRKIMATKTLVNEVHRTLDESLGTVERSVERLERKAETTRVAHENRLAIVERSASRTTAVDKRSRGSPTQRIGIVSAVISTASEFLSLLWKILTLGSRRRKDPRPRPNPSRFTRTRGIPHPQSPTSLRRLETITEDREMPLRGNTLSPDSDPDSDMADDEVAMGPRESRKKLSLKHTVVQAVSRLVALPYHSSVSILKSVTQRLWL